MKKKCAYCGVGFIGQSKRKYCSHKCYTDSKLGKKHTWGDKISRALKGVPKSKEHVLNVIKATTGKPHTTIRGKNHFAWKENTYGYCTVHDYIRLRIGKPNTCKACGVKNHTITQSNGKKIAYLHLSNISGTYSRDIKDWQYVCPKCHSKHDSGRNSIYKTFISKGRKGK